MRLAGKTAFITGASRNIGRAIALTFAAEGADLVLNTRVNREELETVAAECRKAGGRAVPVLGDIADATTVEAMVKQGLAELGTIDVLVCNAAVRPHTSVTETTLEEPRGESDPCLPPAIGPAAVDELDCGEMAELVEAHGE